MSMSLIRKQQKLTRTPTLICWRLPYCLNVVDFILAMTLNSCKTVFRHAHCAKMMQQFLRQNSPDFITADEWASYSPDLNPLDYYIWDIRQDLVYEGRRSTSVCKFTGPHAKRQSKTNGRMSSLKQFVQWKSDWMRLESRMEARFSTFSANCCDWISISRNELY